MSLPKKHRFIYTEQDMDSNGSLVISRSFTHPVIQVWDFYTGKLVPCEIRLEKDSTIISPGFLVFDPPIFTWVANIEWKKLIVVVIE